MPVEPDGIPDDVYEWLWSEERGDQRGSFFGEVRKDEAWAPGCYVVGSGPSLRGFDYESLRGQKIIAVNSAVRFVPWADTWVTCDHT